MHKRGAVAPFGCRNRLYLSRWCMGSAGPRDPALRKTQKSPAVYRALSTFPCSQTFHKNSLAGDCSKTVWTGTCCVAGGCFLRLLFFTQPARKSIVWLHKQDISPEPIPIRYSHKQGKGKTHSRRDPHLFLPLRGLWCRFLREQLPRRRQT